MAMRNEGVRLTLVDDFTTPMAKAAIASRALEKALDDLDKSQVDSAKSATAQAKAVEKQASATPRATSATKGLSRGMDDGADSGDRMGDSINQLTGRLRLFGELAAILGPGLVPIGAVGVGAIAGLANQLGVAALAGGTAVVAFQGVGTALDALNKARLEPTSQNLAAAREAMQSLDPAARKAVRAMRDLRPTLTGIRDAAAGEFFPGFTKSLSVLESRAPDVERVVAALSGALGDLMSDGASSLAGDDWDEFFDFLATDARDTLTDLGTSVGNLTRGFAELWMASDPLSDDFSAWMRDATADFAAWADGLSQTDGFKEFVEYVRENGPQVGETFAAVGDAILQIVEASAPLGGPVLAGLEAVAKAIAAVADSDLGTPIMVGVGALALLNRTLAVTASLSKASLSGGLFSGTAAVGGGVKQFGKDLSAVSYGMVGVRSNMEHTSAAAGRLKGQLATAGKGAAALGGLAIASSGVADSFGATNAASLGLMGSMAGPWGAAAGVAAGSLLDVKAGADGLTDSVDAVQAAIEASDLAALTRGLDDAKAALEETSRPLDALKDGLQLKDATSGDLGGLAIIKSGWAEVTGAAGEARVAVDEGSAAELRLKAAVEQESVARKDSIRTTAQHSGAIGSNSAAFTLATSTVGEFSGAISALNDMLANRSSLRAYEASLDALQEIAGSSNWDVGTEKGREHLQAFDTTMGAAISRAKELKEQGKDLAAVKILQRAQRDLDDFVAKTPAAKGAAKGVRAELESLVGTYRAGIKVDTAAAWNALNQVQNFTFNDKVIRVRTAGVSKGGPHLPAYAEGGTVPTTGLGYADRHPYMLADGEEVISNRHGQADRNRSLLKAINAGYLADGGTAGRIGLANGGTAKNKDGKNGVGFWLSPVIPGLDGLAAALKRSESALTRETSKRDDVIGMYDGVEQALSQKYKSTLFGESKDPFLSSSTGALGTLRGDNASMEAVLAAIPGLKDAGLSKGALAALLQEGSPQEALALAKDPATAKQYQQLFERREALGAQLGTTAADATYGEDRQRMLAKVGGLEAEVKRLNRLTAQGNADRKNQPKQVAAGINGAGRAGRGSHRG